MRKLSKIIATALVAATAITALPAQAQPYPQHRGDRYDDHRGDRYDHRDNYRGGRAEAIRNQIAELQRRVERNDNRDRISEREAAGLRRDVYRLRDQFRDFNRNGLSNREMQVLEQRIQNLRQRLRMERNDWDNRRR